MVVGKGVVYPNLVVLDDVPIDSVGYVVVMVDTVHENAKKLKARSVTRRYDTNSTGYS
jgi:hypothetical protein